MKTFSAPWKPLSRAPGAPLAPALDLALRSSSGEFLKRAFLVDSGAELSMGSRALCDMLGLEWKTGTPVEMKGISQRPECVVAGMIHRVEAHLNEIGCRLTFPICFAEGQAPLLLGREGFFEAFRVEFDMQRRVTKFTLRANPT